MTVDGSEEWHDLRSKGIGGSDASVIMEVSPWKSKIELYSEKVEGIRKDFTGDLLKWGKILEIPVINEYIKDTGRRVTIDEDLCHFSHPVHDFMIGNVDGIIQDENNYGVPGILEVKIKNVYTKWASDWETGNIPIYYKIQMQHYLNITECTWGSFAVLDLGTMKLVWFDVERDDKLINNLVEKEIDFWNMVTNKIKPSPDDSKSCNDFLRGYYSESKKDTIMDLRGNEEAIKQSDILIQAKKLSKSVKESELGAKNYFMELMGDNEKAIGDDFAITWKSPSNKEFFDTKLFKEKYPDIYYEFTHMKPQTRRFSFREK